MADRLLSIAALALLLACNDPKPSGGRRDLSIASPAGGSLGGLVVAASSTEIDLPEGIALAVTRAPGPAVDFGGPPTSDDPTIAAVLKTVSFDTFVVVGMKPGRTVLHFRDGQPESVPVVVTAQP